MARAMARGWGDPVLCSDSGSGRAAALAAELGGSALLAEREYDTLAVRHGVTSPGGSTARGLDARERAGIRGAFEAAIDTVVHGGKR